MSLIEANDYNPNHVASMELNLLELSIREDGFTQPLVCYYDKQKNKYILVDGFHRYIVAKNKLRIKQVPVVTIDKPLEQRMVSTIRHNRARGTHGIDQMGVIVNLLNKNGWSDKEIGKQLGMQLEEVIRFKQTLGLKEAFLNHEFSKSWVTFEEKYYSQSESTLQ